MSELKPVRCGCGGEAYAWELAEGSYILEPWIVMCQTCGCQTGEYRTEAEAVAAWNTAMGERKKGEWIEYPDCLQYEDAYADDQIVCSACHHVFSILDNCTEEFDFCPHCGADMGGKHE